MSKVAALRKCAGLTQEELARLTDVSLSTVRNWENNRTGLEAIVRVARLCRALGCGIEDLYELEKIGQEVIGSE